MKKIFYTIMVFSFIYVFGFMMLVSPARALTGYDDVITASTVWAVKNTPVRQLVGAAASATGGVAAGSYAVEIITVGAPWLALGVAVGLGVAYVYYNSADLVALYNKVMDTVGVAGNNKNIIGQNDGIQPTLQTNTGANGQCMGMTMGYPSWTYDQYIGPFKSNFNSSSVPAATQSNIGWGQGSFAPPQWELVNTGFWPGSTVYYKMGYCHGSYNGTGTASMASLTPADHSAAGLTNWLSNNPADALAPETRHQTIGAGASSPVADTVATLPLTTTEAGPVTTKATQQIGAGDIVVSQSVPAPAGSQQTTTQTQQSTTTTTTTTNPDGSVTEDSTTQTSAVCTAVGYGNRTFGTVLQSHVMEWQGSPVISSISNLSGVVFNSTVPTINFNSTTWGNHSINMSDYGYVFLAIKLIVLACTTILCYRLVFG